MTRWDVAWLLWILIGLGIEALALADRDPEDTLSEHFWRVLKVRTRTTDATKGVRPGVWVARVATLLFGVWLTLHMAFGWWGGGMFPNLWW